MLLFLAIETSQRRGGVALRAHDGNVHVELLAPKKRHDDDLLPAIDRAFSRAKLRPSDLQGGAVGTSIGPGGFTGLRIAVTTAKMFAETMDVKLVAVPSALVAAQSALSSNTPTEDSPSDGDAIVCLTSKNDSCWCTRVRRRAGHWRVQGTPGLETAETLEFAGVSIILADEFLPEPFRIACEQFGVSVIEPSFDPAACLFISERMLREGSISDPLTIAPLYPREPEAVSLWKARHEQG